ncbi:transcriptional repressor NrdR [Kytococcus aerolatus]|uniref:Transcriptional repressor NrdR n=1 Tax=Kytococcus aerolatus TaxID=592308 RepID=A0A212T5S7_9MICO|nr:transcriptional repressor NrdR [Kytococcus aerolatus]
MAVHCPFCRHDDTKVVDSRVQEDGTVIRRRRHCPSCERRFGTLESATLNVVKRSGATEPFRRDKVMSGVRKACQGRPVTDDQLHLLAQEVEESIRATGQAEIDAHEVGMAVLPVLRELDTVAYLRFASVYRNFDSLDDFATEIEQLRREPRPQSPEQAGRPEHESVTA